MAELCTAIATDEELNDAGSWVNNSYEWPQKPYDEICKALGEAIFAWAKVEQSLEALYLLSLQAGASRAGHASWDAHSGFRTRLDMTDSCLLVSDKVKLVPDEWEKLRIRCSKKSLRRNDIAHGNLFYDHHAREQEAFFIATQDYQGSIDKRDYTLNIQHLRDAFYALSADLGAYWRLIQT